MKLILIGNHTCGNRGDAAILRGLIHSIETIVPGVELTITSRFPTSSRYLLGRDVVPDPFAAWHHRSAKLGFFSRSFTKAVPILMLLSLRNGWLWPRNILPNVIQEEIKRLEKYDAVIQVGGSFFVDLYGAAQFEFPFAALIAKRPLHLIGHSMGPFESKISRRMAKTLLDGAKQIFFRESISNKMLERAGLPTQNIKSGADSAWAVVPTQNSRPALRWIAERSSKRPLIAITARELAPFDKRLGTTQDAYEHAFAKMISTLIESGYDVVGASTCTGIDGYFRDDRMVALRISSLVNKPQNFHVAMDEFDDVGLGELFASCTLLIGTRLHSAIIAMNFGTPAIAINYEHKSEGIMRQLGLPELSVSIGSLLDGSLTTQVQAHLASIEILNTRVAEAVFHEKKKALLMVEACFEQHISGAL